MKNIRIYIMMLLALCVTACDEDFNKDVAQPQTNPQETPQVVAGFTIAQDTDFSSAIVMAELEEGTMLKAVKATATPEIAEGASVTFRLLLSDSENFADAIALISTSADNTAEVLAEDLEAIIVELFGKAPEARTAYLRAYVYILDGTSSSMIPEPVDLGTITVTPVAPLIESAYYLVGGPSGWSGNDMSTLLKFSHSGKDVYEDPYFTLMAEVTEDGGWKVVPQSAVTAVENGEAGDIWGAAMGTDQDGDTSLTGTFGPGKGGAMKIEESGWAKITLDLMNSTYEVELIGEMARTLYVPGSYLSWTPADAKTLYTQNLDFKYDGYINLPSANSEFKFTDGPGWGSDGYNEYGTDPNGNEGNLDGGSNITVADAGFYRITVNLKDSPYTYTASKTEWGIIGDATPEGWNASTPMTFDPDTYQWSVTTTLTAGTFKFRANDEWKIDFGGDPDNLSYGGSDIPVSDAGTYTITLDLSDPQAYKATIVKQ